MQKKLSALVTILSFLPFLASAQWNDVTGGISYNTGNVGIGTTVPQGGLHIATSANSWSNYNFGTNLLLQGSRHNSIGIFDAVNANPWAIVNNSGDLCLAMMPPLGNVTASPIFKVTFGATGNVGIGTKVPLGGLHIATSANSWSSYNFGTNLLLQGTGNNSIGIFDSTNSNPWAVVNSSGKLSFAMMPPLGDITTNPSLKVTFSNNGNVGIGTPTPLEKLDIQGGNASIYNNGSSSKLIIGSTGTGKTSLLLQTSADADGYATIESISASGTNYGNTIINPVLGNVGIGTINTKGHKLAVNGSIIASSVQVQLYGDWPDYVFSPAYKLPSLSEVKTFIDQNQHLPEIPSEAEIKHDGINLGDMNKLLLKKVEELTLYLIDQNKQLQENQKENSALRQDLEALKKKVYENQ